jgi:hypothetical protein
VVITIAKPASAEVVVSVVVGVAAADAIVGIIAWL